MIKFQRGFSSSNIVGIPAMQTPPFPVVIETSRFCICVFLCVFLYLLALQLCGPLCRNRDIWSGSGNVLEKKKNSRKQFLIIIFICCESNQIWFNLRNLRPYNYHLPTMPVVSWYHCITVSSYQRIIISLYQYIIVPSSSCHRIIASSHHHIIVSPYHRITMLVSFPPSRLMEIQSRPHWETWR